jgi:putative NADH-flavin reductase
MAHLIILGATGNLGRHVLGQALAAGHDVAVVVRNPSRLPPDVRGRLSIHIGDLKELVPPDIIRGHDALINCAGYVADGQGFVDLVHRVVTSAESLQAAEQPVCWFLAGAALLDIDASGRRGVDIPQVSATYWPHRLNFDRLSRSELGDWRLLCPGPMVDEPPLGVERLRISVDRLPVEAPAVTGAASDSLVMSAFGSLIAQMIVPYADAAALMLANLDRGNVMARHRLGLALPAGMRGRKPQ